jgi:polysaccharide biosynthesis/export protein
MPHVSVMPGAVPTSSEGADMRSHTPLGHRIAAGIALLLTALTLGACSDGFVNFPTTPEGQQALGEDVEVIVLEAANIGGFIRPARSPQATSLPNGRNWAYHVGVGRYPVGHRVQPARTDPSRRAAAQCGGKRLSGRQRRHVQLSLYRAGFRRGGALWKQIRGDISQRLQFFIADPQVDVRLASYNSQAIVVSGEVGGPNRQALTSVPLTLIEAVNAAGGFKETADQRAVTVQRGGHTYPVDVQGFLSGGLTQNNPVLRNGDIVFVPRRRAEEAYLLGEIGRPNAIDLSREPITLTQAITRSGGLVQPRADARGVLVFRVHGHRTRVFQLDTSNPTGLLLGTRFVLEPGDVVYILRSPLQRWNDTIVRLLPSVQAVNVANTLAN